MRVFKTMPIIAIAAEAEHTITTPGDSHLYCIVRSQFILPYLQRSLWYVAVRLQKSREKIKIPHFIGKKVSGVRLPDTFFTF